MSDKILNPAEWLEEQLHMSDEDKSRRQEFFTEMFRRHGFEVTN